MNGEQKAASASRHAAQLIEEGGRYSIILHDVPGAFGGGASLEEAIASAEAALAEILLHHMAAGEEPPAPASRADAPDHLLISVPAQTAAKLAVWQAWRASGISKSELARRLGKAENQARRILDPDHPTELKALDQALRALGFRLEVSARPAA